jgi:hypothetical protein
MNNRRKLTLKSCFPIANSKHVLLGWTMEPYELRRIIYGPERVRGETPGTTTYSVFENINHIIVDDHLL